jgi:DNA repair photolyase
MGSLIPDVKIKEIEAKGIITETNLPGADFVVNPYTGCQHGCIYCYAEFMKKYTGHDERWGDFVDIKINAPDLIKVNGKFKGKIIFFSSVTDPYQPVEAKYCLTRKILEKLVEKQPKISLLTKSALVTRDIDIFKKFKEIDIGVSISTLDEKLSRQLEPFASPPKLRMESIKKLKASGLKTWIFISPIFPYITEIEEIIKEVAPNADYFMFENLNLRAHNRNRVYDFIWKNRPDLLPAYKNIYENKDNKYWDDLRLFIIDTCRKYKKDYQICFHHGGFSKN